VPSYRPAVSVHTVKDVLSLLGQYLLTGEGVALTRRAVASARTVAVHASALLQQTIITPCSRAWRNELTVHRLPVHSAQRRATLETGGLTVVSAYLPSVSVSMPCPVLGARSPPNRIKCGSWAGAPQRVFYHGHVAGPALRSPP
jgi:hypothetical protein